MSNHFFWTITLVISSFLFGCTTAMELDTNGYITKFGKESEKYCPNKTSENISKQAHMRTTTIAWNSERLWNCYPKLRFFYTACLFILIGCRYLIIGFALIKVCLHTHIYIYIHISWICFPYCYQFYNSEGKCITEIYGQNIIEELIRKKLKKLKL